MSDVAARELRNDTRGVLERVEAGEAVTITMSGRPVAVLQPLTARAQWIRRADFVRRLVQADSRLSADLAALAPDTTDDLEP